MSETRFKPYPETKDSGIEWLGQIPEHWGQKPLWTMFSRVKRTGFQDEELLSVYRDYGVIPKSSRDDNFNKASEDLSSYQLVRERDLVTNKMKAWQGSIAISAWRGIVSPAYHVYEPHHRKVDRFLHYLFRSSPYVCGYGQSSKGIRVNQWDLDPELFVWTSVLLPTEEEQQAIADFLDHETAKIDALVERKKRLVELLQEKRTALITHAVTKGLDPDVPMRDSGIEWLGQIPAHWKATRLKRAASRIADCPHETPTYTPDGEYFVIRTADVSLGRLDLTDAFRVNEEEFLQRVRRLRLAKGDIVYGREGERWGFAASVPEHPTCCLGQRMMQFRTGESFHPRFLMWHINAACVYQQGAIDTAGATSPHVNVETIRNYSLVQPAFNEQQAIASYLDRETARIDTLIAKVGEAIERLKEYRTALISAAVTGKIDVRDEAEEQLIYG